DRSAERRLQRGDRGGAVQLGDQPGPAADGQHDRQTGHRERIVVMSVQTEARVLPTKRAERRAARARRIREPKTDRIFLFCVYLLLLVFLAVVLLPLLYLVASPF